MKFFAAVLLVAVSTATVGGLSFRSLVFPTATKTSYVEMIPLKPLELKAFTLCMAVATELRGEREVILFAYRTGDYDELNVWRELDGRLSFYLSGEGVMFQVPELGPLMTHLCFTWDSGSGAATVFMNGRKSLSKIYKKGHMIQAGGRVILGQDPDSFLGDFQEEQSFVGEVVNVNMWDSVLSQSEISNLVAGVRVQRGNVLDWERVELQMHGEVQVVEREM